MKRLLPSLLMLLAVPGVLHGQCPDGTPPPCRPAQAVARAVAPAAPALSDATWLVLPFENLARSSEVEWLRDASANLLYLELSRWQEVRVIDDERVADWLRRSVRGQVTLETGLEFARRHGAGRLVMGDVLQVGGEIRLVAKVFRTRDGERVLNAQVTVPGAEAALHGFTSLAREMLGLASAPVREAAIGTNSLPAYRAYLSALRSIGLLDFDGARAHLQNALAHDSTFALAHARLSAAHHLSHGGASAEIRRHAAAAQRLGTGLPERERRMISANFAMAEGRFEDACGEATRVLTADSLDVEAWYLLGECSFHDPAVIAGPGQPRFRSSWEQARRAFEQAVALAPWAPLAFQHLPTIYSPLVRRQGCDVNQMPLPCTLRWSAPLLVDGDTLSTPLAPDSDRVPPPEVSAIQLRQTFELLIERQLAVTTDLVALSPDDATARLQQIRALLASGQVARAANEAASLSGPDTADPEGAARLELLVDAALRGGDTERAAARLGAAEALVDTTQATAPMRTTIAALRAMMGQFSRIMPGPPSPGRTYILATFRVAAGLPVPALDQAVAAHLAAVPPDIPAAMRAEVTALFGRSGELAAFLTGHPVQRVTADTVLPVRVARLGSSGNPEAALALLEGPLARLDSLARPEFGFTLKLQSTRIHLMRGDSLAALDRLRGMVEQMPWVPHQSPFAGEAPVFTGHLLAHAALLAGDLATALGDTMLARTAYREVVNRWALADPELQPAVARAQERLAGVTR